MFYCFQQQKTILFNFLVVWKDVGVKRYLKYTNCTCWGKQKVLSNVQILIQRRKLIQSNAAGSSVS